MSDNWLTQPPEEERHRAHNMATFIWTRSDWLMMLPLILLSMCLSIITVFCIIFEWSTTKMSDALCPKPKYGVADDGLEVGDEIGEANCSE